MSEFLCSYCWENVEELYPSDDDLCLDCHDKLTRPVFSDEVDISFRQVKWAVSEINKKNRRIAELEAENEKLKVILSSFEKSK
ncbi:MAG: hypothetical protein M3405_13640 [Acidobacteriota bacterium]|jgi:hypothetical protein|nr:hypothetical protein [Acidobacteriota bacterium]